MRALGVLAAVATVVSAAQAQGRTTTERALFNRIEVELDWADIDGADAARWQVDGWIGGDFERVWIRSEGDVVESDIEAAEAQIYYGWNVSDFWDVLVGLRQDFEPESRTYLAASLVGLAPYFIETEASAFLSDDGVLSLRLEHSLDLLLTQRLVLEPHVELNAFAQDVPQLGIGAGFADVSASLQVRYEIARKFAPYVELEWERKLGETAGLARAAGSPVEETALRVGLRIWF